MKEYQLFLVISVHVEKQCSCPLSRRCKLHVLHFTAIISLLIKGYVWLRHNFVTGCSADAFNLKIHTGISTYWRCVCSFFFVKLQLFKQDVLSVWLCRMTCLYDKLFPPILAVSLTLWTDVFKLWPALRAAQVYIFNGVLSKEDALKA